MCLEQIPERHLRRQLEVETGGLDLPLHDLSEFRRGEAAQDEPGDELSVKDRLS